MDSAEPAELAKGDHGSSAALIRDVRAGMAQAATIPSEDPPLVLGVWRGGEDLCVVALGGEMDMHNVDKLAAALQGRIPPGPCRLVVELSELTFVDSTGIHALAVVARDLAAVGSTVVLAAPTRHVARVLELVNLDMLIPIASSLEEALEAR
jgi:anti-anti-sigma factor